MSVINKVNNNSSSKEIAISVVNKEIEDNSKKYIEHSKKLLEDFKMMQSVISSAKAIEVPVLIKVAQSNLNRTCTEHIDAIIKDIQHNFNEKSIAIFREKSISIITSMDTANFLYGSIVEINEIKKYLSSKLTKLIILRSEKLLSNLKTTSFEEKGKITVIVDNLNLSIKMLEYGHDIYPSNIVALKQSKKILETLVLNRVKLGIDNYNVELLKILIDKHSAKIESFKSPKEVGSSLEEEMEKINNKNILIDGNYVAYTVNSREYEENSSETALVVNKSSITDKFIEMSNNVIKDVINSDSNDFLSIALQKFYSIITSIETVNFLKGETINKRLVTENISNLITDLVFKNYTAILRSWKELTNKTAEDNAAFYKELLLYKEIYLEAYSMAPQNYDTLKKCIDVELTIFNNKIPFNISKGQESILNQEINAHVELVKKYEPSYSPAASGEGQKKVEKKKSWWSKIFN